MTTSPTAADAVGVRRVVVGVSGSKASLAALNEAAREAKLRDAVLHVITVDEPRARLRAPYARPHDDEAAPDRESAGAEVAALAPGLARIHERMRGPAPRMLQLAARGAELLVIGRTDCADLLGPTARACVVHAACPVLVVAPTTGERDVREDASVGAPA